MTWEERVSSVAQQGFTERQAAFPVTVTSTVGAGDAFNAGLLYQLRLGRPLEEAVRYGNAVAALVISSGQGILGCPTLDQVNEFLRTSS